MNHPLTNKAIENFEEFENIDAEIERYEKIARDNKRMEAFQRSLAD